MENAVIAEVADVSGTCETHGRYKAKRWTLPTGRVMLSPCPVCRDEIEQSSRAARENSLKLRFRQELVEAGIGARYFQASFDNYRVSRPEEKFALERVRDYTNAFERRKSPNMIMHGETGTGKTHLACAMASELILRGVSVKYLPVLNLFSQYHDIVGYGGDGKREEFYGRMRAPDFLIIDEFGLVTMKESERIALHRVIDERYNRLAPTCIIGNIDLEKLGAEVGERAMRRVMAEAIIVRFDWEATPVNRDLFAEEDF